MARKSAADDVFALLTMMPWWVGITAAILLEIARPIVMPGPSADIIKNNARPLINFVFHFFAGVSLVAAAVSAVKSKSRKRLLDMQTSLESLKSLSWRDFEHLVGEAYRRQGYDVEETGGGGADGGVDLVLRGHNETVLVQCKQWRQQRIGVDKVRELFGVMTAEGAKRGILVTTGNFTNDARSFKVGKPLVLVDGPALAELVLTVQTSAQPVARPSPPPPRAHPVASQPVAQPETPAAESSGQPACPACGTPMILRTAKRGANAGASFFGCPNYPACRGTRPAP